MKEILLAVREQRWQAAADGLAEVVAYNSDPNLRALLGVSLLHLHQTTEAAGHFEQVLLADPNQVDALFHLGLIRELNGVHDAAMSLFRQVIRLRPSHASAHLHLARLATGHGDPAEALSCWRRLHQLRPEDPEPWRGMSVALSSMGFPDQAIVVGRQAVQLAPADSAAHAWLGTLLVERGLLDEALPHLQQSGTDEHARIALISLNMRRGNLEEADALLAQHAPAEMSAEMLEVWARRMAQKNAHVQGIAHLSERMDAGVSHHDQIVLLHARADLHDKIGHCEAAFDDWSAANRLRPKTFDPVQNRVDTDHRIACFSEPIQPIPAPSAPQVVLIVGMPRSGSSLLEQMLDGHTQLYGAGELRCLHDALQELPQIPSNPLSLPRERLREIGEMYVHALQGREGGHGRVILDKMPHNFRNLGVAAAIVPGLRIIHCVRDPVDVGFSCFRQRFRDGMSYTTRLDWLASFQADCQRLMAHWKMVLPQEMLLEVRYEELVTHPEQTIRTALSFLGHSFEESCLSPEKNRRGIATASRDEVTHAVHRSSIGRSTPYRAFLEPLITRLSLNNHSR